MRRLTGGSKGGDRGYIWSADRRKLYSKRDKINRFKETWEPIFDISPEENATFDKHTEKEVKEYLLNNQEITIPYEIADLTRLERDSELTRPISVFDLMAIIAKTKNKAPGESGINKEVLKNLPRAALERMADIINILLSMGYFSVKFKNGHMIFAQKEGKDEREALNYRPITLLEVPGKISEKIVNERFMKFLENTRKINKNQFGFRNGYGTEMAITKVYEKVAMNQHQRSQCNIVCRDVAKAFDKVWHRGLKFKILHLELPSIVERILCSFLDDRTAQIKMYGMLSDRFQLRSSVPQGSVLSPTLLCVLHIGSSRGICGGDRCPLR